ncbi:hypothetical protein Dred_1098 [Desulforamulus reducens MI-1]|uniref:Uncharacterized protein n=1 Tax=Desulforamulus reducens (strain ATCC BAA-1160 / DSM 100696 / MI-1) TaxID=349161 RepID=A4J3I0_DESRM|nr:hypothetical protein [Desulforamulus reducens]ABO49633.1 hypothetical protein Dred_1098 [Desulforamulus reducens MI-1]
MRIFLIARVKQKILKAMRFALVLTILTILLVQMAGMLKKAGFHSEEKIPSGNPMKVMAPVSKACEGDQEHRGLEKIFEQLLKYIYEKNKKGIIWILLK